MGKLYLGLLVWVLVSTVNQIENYHGFYFSESQCQTAGSQLIDVDKYECRRR
jgi:hypothetical protein